MDILQFHRIIELDLQKMGFFAYSDMESEEIDIQINRQIDFLINGILDKNFGRALKINEEQGFQKDQVTLDNLRSLHIRNSLLTIANNTADVESSCPLPVDYSHNIRSTVVITYFCYDPDLKKQKEETEEIPVILQESQYYLKDNPLYKSAKDGILGEIVGDNLYLSGIAGVTFSKVKMSYIRKPAIVKYGKNVDGDYDASQSVQCDLDESLHQMLARMTSIEIMKIIESNPNKTVSMQQDQI